MRGSFNAPAAQLARQRTLAFLAQNLRGAAPQPHA
jgi:dienelactone hydrolase